MIDMGQGHGARDIEATLVLLLEGDVWWLLVDANSEALELRLDHPLVRQGLVHVEHNEDQMARLGDGDDLATSTSTVLGTLDNSGKVDNLQGGAW